MTAMELVEKAQLLERPRMKAGDTVKVHVRVKEGDKERIQIFEGVVIGLRRGGNRATFTVRKVSFSQGVGASSRCTRRRFRKSRSCDREGPPRQAVLPARPEGQGRSHEGSQENQLVPVLRITRAARTVRTSAQGQRATEY